MKTLKDLVGYRLMSLNKNGFTVMHPETGHQYRFNIHENDGDCCGYNEIKTTFHMNITKKKAKRLHLDINTAPAITKVEYLRDDSGEEDYCMITFFGLDKELGIIESTSSSGSGWGYGATVTVLCHELDFEETITSY